MTKESQTKPNKWLIILGPSITVFLIALGFVWWDRGAFPGFRPTLYERSITEISLNDRGVRLKGMARYDIKTKQLDDHDQLMYYIFPLVPLDDINSKTIHVMVRSKIPPDDLAMIEERTVEGVTKPPTRIITTDLRRSWMRLGYRFDKRFVLVDSFDDELKNP
ncbi:MAG: hypothetical protein CMK59_00970 [Proteobacteria bacterium]|nr:hypothetical protein [Pseudomonadota bacterium]